MTSVLRHTTFGCIATILCVCLSSCGYNMQSSLDPKYQTIHIAAFQNQSRQYDLQAPLTNSVIRKFMNDGRLRVVNKDMADLILEGTITDYDLRGVSFDRDDEITQIEMNLRSNVRVIEPRTGTVLWSQNNISSLGSFSAVESGTANSRLRGNTQTFLPAVRSFQTDAENMAASEALEQLASIIFYRTIEPW